MKRKPKTLRAIQPNAGIRAAYRKRLLALINEMAKSYTHWLRAAYRAHPPEMAHDEVPSAELKRSLQKLSKRWKRNFDTASEELAEYFATRVEHRTRANLMGILKKGGWTVERDLFKMTATMRDVMTAMIAENVSLIKSIPAQFHTQVEGSVMRAVVAGGDLQQMTRDLQKQFGVTRRRAEFIARDQSSKATAAITRTRYIDLGIEEAIWMHSAAGKTKRPTHVANNGKRFNIRTGWFDPDPKVRRHIQAGELINCKCTARPVIRGFS
jgi:SPP1 gp7 family putative phage head morphogenesis protein